MAKYQIASIAGDGNDPETATIEVLRAACGLHCVKLKRKKHD